VQTSTAIGKPLFGGLKADEDTLISVMAMLAILLRETLSEDVIHMVICAARQQALQAGVPASKFDEVQKKVIAFWTDRKSRHPLAGMF